jgi:hypothetical protein
VITPVTLSAKTEYAVLVFHGSGGKDEPRLLEIAAEIDNLLAERPATEVRHVIWSPWSDNRLRAGSHGRRIGAQLGEELSQLDKLKNVRLIAHSAGAYLLDPLCRALREQSSRRVHIEMTFLDGMGIRGGWDFNYGYRHYGECADFSAYIYNSDEPVPGTNAPATPSWSLDVTNSRDRSDSYGHLWPVEFFQARLNLAEVTPRLRTHKELPRGIVVSAD